MVADHDSNISALVPTTSTILEDQDHDGSTPQEASNLHTLTNKIQLETARNENRLRRIKDEPEPATGPGGGDDTTDQQNQQKPTTEQNQLQIQSETEPEDTGTVTDQEGETGVHLMIDYARHEGRTVSL